MMRHRTLFILCCVLTSLGLSVNDAASTQSLGREYAPIKRLRPADVHLENVTISIRVTATDHRASHLRDRLQQILTAKLHGANPNLRRADSSPQVVLECSLNRLDFDETWETRTSRNRSYRYKIVKCALEAAYQVVRPRDNHVYAADTISPGQYSREFLDGEGAPPRSAIEDALLDQIPPPILRKLANTEETFDVRLMRKDELRQCAGLAEINPQWLQYIECVNALPEKPDEHRYREYNGDRQYDIGIAYEALAYEMMWKDYDRAARYFELAEQYFRKAQRFDSREEEYGRALARMNQGKQYFEIVKTRFPKKPEVGGGTGGKGMGETISSNAMTNEKVVEMVKAGLPEDIILAAIKQAEKKQFDVSPNALIQLRRQGVSAAIIREIQRVAAPPRRR